MTDRVVGGRWRAEPPTVALHPLRGCFEAIDDGSEVGVRVVEAEDEPAGTDPTKGETFGAKVVLQHPVVARWLFVQRRANRRQMRDLQRKIALAQPSIERFNARIPHRVQIAVDLLD